VNAPELTGKLAAATFEHDTARPVDGYAAPQLHTHAVIFNLTERDNGQTRAFDARNLFGSQGRFRIPKKSAIAAVQQIGLPLLLPDRIWQLNSRGVSYHLRGAAPSAVLCWTSNDLMVDGSTKLQSSVSTSLSRFHLRWIGMLASVSGVFKHRD